MSHLPEGVYQGAGTHDDASLFRARMKEYAKRAQARQAAEQRLRSSIEKVKPIRRANA